MRLRNLPKDSEDGIFALKQTLFAAQLGIAPGEIVLVQGNHDPAGTREIAPGGAHDPAHNRYGVFVINASIAGVGAVTEPVKVTVENGVIASIEGGSDAEKLRDILTKPDNPNCFRISELGIGLNPCAIPCGSLLEDEAPLGTVHIAAGNNASNFPGGQVSAPVHIDMIAKDSTVYIDDVAILVNGEFQYSAIN